MKFEKRGSGAPEPGQESQPTPPSGGKKPVVIYIMILFIVAFVMMAVSFIMHQRSNSEVIGKLQDSVSTLQEIQAVQDENIQLREQLEQQTEETADLQRQLEEAAASAESAQKLSEALTGLYTLQQQYATQDYEGCKKTIAAMEESGLDKLLPAETDSGVTSPAQRYLQLREAVESR